MIDYLGYNLTEYKEFRQLQLQYLKTVAHNQSLQKQIQSLREAYEEKRKELIRMKSEEMEEKLKLKNKNLKYKKLYKQLLEHIESSLAHFRGKSSPKNNDNKKTHILIQNPNSSSLSSSHLNTSSNDKSLFIHIQQAQTVQKVCKKLTQMTKDYMTTKQANTHLSKRLQHFTSEYKSQFEEKEKTQIMIIKQIQNLEIQLEQLNQVNVQLEAKVNIREKQKKKMEMEVRHAKQVMGDLEQKVTQLMKQKQDRTQQDSEFALDFMTYQLHSIQTMFTRLSSSTKCSQQLSNLMSILYSDYQQLSQIFREKLQIQYDLEELQQRYKSEKSSDSVDETLLIETRRQIQAFRLQLLKQKEVFRQKEQFVEDHFEEYLKINQQEMKIKNYSYQLENLLYKQKRSAIETCERIITTRNPTARQILMKRPFQQEKRPFQKEKPQNSHSQTNIRNHSQANTRNQSQTNTQNRQLQNQDFIKFDLEEDTVDNKEESRSIPSKKTSLRFRQTKNAEQIINEIIQKDKANMEKILKETRKTAIPFYMGKRQ